MEIYNLVFLCYYRSQNGFSKVNSKVNFNAYIINSSEIGNTIVLQNGS